MSKETSKGSRRPGANRATYEVGYRKPPKSSQFQPGRSGNPGGRPKGRKKSPPVDLSQVGPTAERMKELILEEAYREIVVRDGEHMSEIPVIQAVLRSVALNAAKGQQRAQRMFTDLLQCVEREKRAFYEELLQEAVQYKEKWEGEIERCRKQGLPEPEPVPHPDDVVINRSTGVVEFHGPVMAEEKRYLDQLEADHADYSRLAKKIEAALNTKPRSRKLAAPLARVKAVLQVIEERRRVLSRPWS